MRDVVGFEGLYKVTIDGKVWSCRQRKFMSISGGKGNYQMIGLKDRNHKIHYDYVHRLVAKAYIPNPANYPEVNHKDEVKDNNHVSNLEWCTRNYNLRYSEIKGRPSVPVYCVELDKTFKSMSDAAKETGVAQGNLSTLLKRRNPQKHSLGGYHWRYA